MEIYLRQNPFENGLLAHPFVNGLHFLTILEEMERVMRRR